MYVTIVPPPTHQLTIYRGHFGNTRPQRGQFMPGKIILQPRKILVLFEFLVSFIHM